MLIVSTTKYRNFSEVDDGGLLEALNQFLRQVFDAAHQLD